MNFNLNRYTQSFSALILLGVLILMGGVMASISIGSSRDVGVTAALHALLSYDGSRAHLLVMDVRLPRALTALLVGANLAVAGVIMQGLTRNPLASPAILGVNAGASLFVAAALTFLPALGGWFASLSAFFGAAVGGIAVLLLAGLAKGRIDSGRLVLGGFTVSAFMASATNGIVLMNERSLEQVMYWLVGAVDGRNWTDVHTALPWSLFGLATAIGLSRRLDALALGEDVAHGLGVSSLHTRLLGGLSVILLAGSAVTVAGPIPFVGLMAPHIGRLIAGRDHFRLIAFSALLGAALLVVADICARFISFPYESPVGIVTGLLGAPFFLYLSRAKRGGE